ncbi:hypothetical protein BW723_00310 [Polaribacter reichenbachii]|uniref:Secretion system C-terminal sorting domain-containing protein n=1 Tax=Polaribacter reichenbachii TaxID=996801 RepID=A0A1B8U4L1_9FLAO|nr:LamG-like jellyroll fold domain-containing protein [Polaribacter reichenbachii]APZ44823.1 hypothetical protein BW723_00310 [Polaribacter reichenbachii]AUC18687.1 hypothetical protein BTO17_08315 [Polaribacter reichenbachii]OBY66800.1 hypothetical protein LPB301_05060 [Polaribacter reichenbachii]
MKTKLQITLFFIFLANVFTYAQTDYVLEFNGVDQRIKYETDATLDKLNGVSDYTIEVWVKPLSTEIHNRVILKRWNQFALTLYKDADKRFYFTHYSPSGNTFVNTINNVINIDEWNHLVVVCSSATNSVKLYANGVDVTLSDQVALPLASTPEAANFYVAYGGSGTYLNANIDKVRIKNTTEIITSLQTDIADADYTSDDNTVVLLNFNEGSGTATLNESSSNSGELACIATDCTQLPTWVELSNTLAVNKLNSTLFKIFPNPSFDKSFTIQTSNNELLKSMEMFSVLGKSVKKIDITEKKNKIVVNATELNNGIYFVKTVTDKGAGIKKIMIK